MKSKWLKYRFTSLFLLLSFLKCFFRCFCRLPLSFFGGSSRLNGEKLATREKNCCVVFYFTWIWNTNQLSRRIGLYRVFIFLTPRFRFLYFIFILVSIYISSLLSYTNTHTSTVVSAIAFSCLLVCTKHFPHRIMDNGWLGIWFRCCNTETKHLKHSFG